MALTSTGYDPNVSQDIINAINQIFINVFGADVNLNTASVNGQFINQLGQLAQQNQNFMTLLTSSLYNPDLATGLWLDALCSFNGILRNAGTYSTVTCTCYGSAGTVIPAGTLIQNTNGDVFSNTASVTIGSGGTITAFFQAVRDGIIPVTANTVNNIITQIYGWDSVNNLSDGTVGTNIQSDNSLRASRTALLSKYSSASIGALYSNLVQGLDLVNQYVYVTENNTSAPITIAGVTLVAYSIYVSIVTTSTHYPQVAQIIYNKKCPGINQNGSITQTYTDTASGTIFTAQFDVPTPTALQVNITYPIATPPTLVYPTDFVSQIQTAIVNNFNGVDPNANTLTVGIYENINVSRFVPSLLVINLGGTYTSLTIQLKTGGTPAPNIQLPANELATLSLSDVIVSFA